MIEIIFKDYLAAMLSDVPFYMEEPEAPPEKYVVLQKTGSDRANQILEATFLAQSYAGSLYEAMVLNQRVIDAALAMTPADGVFSVRLNTDYPYNNTETKQYRYQAIFQIYY